MTNMATTTQPAQTPGFVGILPPTAPTPQPPRRIAFFKALFFFWLRPKKLGPHIIAGTIRRAFFAHAISMAVALIAATIVFLVIQDSASSRHSGIPDDLSAIETIRWVMTRTIMHLAVKSSRSAMNSVLVAGLAIGALPLLEFAIGMSAVLLMPHVAGGDTTSSVFDRSLKAVYWASTILIPMAVLAVITSVCSQSKFILDAGVSQVVIVASSGGLAFALLAIALRAASVAGHQYVGPAEGPAFTEREPQCETCGYILLGLPIEARCPECGTFVAESLPGGRRKPTLWQEQGIRLRGVLDLLRLHVAVLLSGTPLTRIPVQSNLKAALHFFAASCVMMMLVLLALLRLAASFEPSGRGLLLAMAPLSITFSALPLLSHPIVTFAACLWSQFRHGIRDYRVSAIICCYACPLQWPLLLVLLAASCVLCSGYAAPLASTQCGTLLGVQIDGLMLVFALAGLFTLACLGFWFRRLLAAIWAARFANV